MMIEIIMIVLVIAIGVYLFRKAKIETEMDLARDDFNLWLDTLEKTVERNENGATISYVFNWDDPEFIRFKNYGFIK